MQRDAWSDHAAAVSVFGAAHLGEGNGGEMISVTALCFEAE
jgi:hypothetical protein